MKFTNKDIEELKTVLAACKVIGVDAIVIHEGLARGAKPSLDAALLTAVNLSISEDTMIGIGRAAELDKRLSVFSADVSIDGKCNDEGIATMLTMSAGKSKMQFRCTSPALMRYPKANDDQPFAIVSLSRTEITQLSKAAKTLGAETIIVHISRDGTATMECVDSSNDKFVISLEKPVEFIDEKESVMQTYLAGLLADVLDASAKDNEDVTFVLGQAGSITATAKGHTLLVMPQITGED